MVDEDLRRLEREATRGDPGACLALVQALRRAGRPDDAVAALRLAWRDPAARAELARVPAWTHARGPDRTSYLDVRPLRSTPRLLWHLPDLDALPETRRDPLIGGSLGLITCRGRLRLDIVDPESGAVHASTPAEPRAHDGGLAPLTLAGEVLLVHGDGADARSQLRALTLDGRDLLRVELALERDVPRVWELRGGGALDPEASTRLKLPRGLRHRSAGYTVQGHGLVLGVAGRPRGAPVRAGFAGSVRLAPDREVIHAWSVTTTPRARDARHLALDRATGKVRWRGEGAVWAHDESGTALWLGREVAIRRADGALAWRRALEGEGGHPLALTPERVVALEGRAPRLVAMERATGRVVADLGPQHGGGPPYWSPVVVVARDVVYVAYGEGLLVAVTLGGERLWTVSMRELARALGLREPDAAARLHSLVPATDRLFARAFDGTIYAFGAA